MLGLATTLVFSVVVAAPAEAAVVAQPVATGLDKPVAFTLSSGGRIFYGERFTGEIRIFNPATSTNRLFFTIPNMTTVQTGAVTPQHVVGGEHGLLGLALHPDYPTTPYVYAFATREANGTHENHVLRIKDVGGKGTDMRVLFRSEAATFHNGGRLLFGPNRLLYVVIGDRGDASNAQDLNTPAGKVLRMTPAGAVPDGNPFAGSYVFAYGIRNSFGMAFDPLTGRLWETENGPECNDELNRITRGGNFGWGPTWTCTTPPSPPANTNRDGPSPILPKRFYTPPTAPTGAAFCDSCGLGAASEGALFYGTYNTQRIRRATLSESRYGVASETAVYTHSGPVLSVERGPDGRLYFSDNSAIYRLATS